MKVFIQPNYSNSTDRAEGGIRRVVEAQNKYLPQFGVEVTDDIRTADVTAGHGVMSPVAHGLPFVSHCHGLHWTDYKWLDWAYDVNRQVTEAMIQAQLVTAPSQWVAHAITRGVFIAPTVVYHGVDAAEWAYDGPVDNYVIWDKARADAISDPNPMMKLAERMTDVSFVTTIGKPNVNVHVLGVVPVYELKPVKQRAAVYLATTRETMGIGTLEALAAGVPVAGFRYGGTEEIVIEGETGYLAEWGDYDGLDKAVRKCLADRARLSANAVQDARTRWAWPDKIERYAKVYKAAVANWNLPRPKVSIVVPCHNLGRYLGACLDSVRRQPFHDFECVIVDDASDDNSAEVAKRYVDQDTRFKYLRTPQNLKLVGTLNYGAAQSRGKYVVNLDADNMLPEDALSACVEALDTTPDLHIVYGALDTVNSDGNERRRNPWPAGAFDWRAQSAHINQIHSSAMMRREVRERSGGYRERMWRAEDAEFWLRVTSFGFRAQRITDSPTLIYRLRNDSKSMGEGGDGYWNEWFPWRMATTAQDGWKRLQAGRRVPNQHLVPFSAAGVRVGKLFWDVHHHQTPTVSVIIPMAPHHLKYVIDALDSCVAQDFPFWEVIVINNGDIPVRAIPGAPYARIINMGKATQVGAARNAGVAAAKGPIIYFLDADDYMLPGGMLAMLKEYVKGDAGYIYSDYMEVHADHSQLLKQMHEYDQNDWKSPHAVNIMMAKADFNKIGGFVDGLIGWEDWDLYCKMGVNGLCGKRIAVPTFAYRKFTGTRRDESAGLTEQLLADFKKVWGPYYDGDKPMSACCGGNSDAIMEAKASIEASERSAIQGGSMAPTGAKPQTFKQTNGLQPRRVRMEFNGPNFGPKTLFGVDGPGRQYQGGMDPMFRYADVDPKDIAKLESTGEWTVVSMPPEPEPEVIFDDFDFGGGLEPESTPQETSTAVETSATPTEVAQGDGSGDDIDALLATLPDAPKTSLEAEIERQLKASVAKDANATG